MTTATTAFRRAIRMGNGVFGHIFPITSLTTTTVVCDALKMGEPASKYVNWYMVRRNATTTADRIRQVTAFDGSTGTLTHAGTNYSDTTATSEYVELYPFSPIQLDQYAAQVLPECRRYHRDILPAHGGDTYYLDRYPWIGHRGHVQRLLHGSRDLGRNGQFNDWNTVSSAGALEPDNWTLSGASATWTRSTTNPYRGPYEVAVTRAGTDAVVRQFVGAAANNDSRSLLPDGVDSLAGEDVALLFIARAGTASRLRGFIDDGSTVTYTSYHTGGSTNELLTATATLPAAAIEASYGFTVATGDITGYVSECRLLKSASVDDSFKAGNLNLSETQFGWQDRPPALRPNHKLSRGSSYVLESWRPYPELDSTRLLAGSHDADTSDIDVDLWAVGIMAKTYEGAGENYEALGKKYRAEYENLRAANRWDVRPSVFRGASIAPVRRV